MGVGFAFIDKVYGVAGVMFAVAGRGADLGTSRRAFATFGFDIKEEAILVFYGAKRGGDAELDTFGFGFGNHFVDRDLNGCLKLELAIGIKRDEVCRIGFFVATVVEELIWAGGCYRITALNRQRRFCCWCLRAFAAGRRCRRAGCRSLGKCALDALGLPGGLLADGFPLPDDKGGDRAKTQNADRSTQCLSPPAAPLFGRDRFRRLPSSSRDIFVRRSTHRHDFDRTTARVGRFQGWLVGRGLLSKLTRLMGYEFASIQRKLCSNLQSFG